jgi:latrophilin 1
MPICIKILVCCRCDRLNSCRVPVNSDLFGDPCPETHKYVEIHYTCAPTEDTIQQRPPWYIHPSLNGSSLLPPLPWLKDDIRSSDLPKNGGSASAPRIPILVATTTSTPKRIPITSSPPPTTTATTTLKTTTVASPVAVVVTTAGKGMVVGDSTRPDDDEYVSEDEDGLRDELAEENDLEEEEEGRLVESSLVDMREQEEGEEGEGGDYCRPSLARNLYWQQTPRGQPHVQPCPNGATGSARWLCSHHQVGRKNREMENISRGPTFRDFVTILTERSM